MLGGKNQKPLGYTIIEVMIVLAVSGVIFLIAANFINGKQARTAFNQGVNGMASRIQDVIEQVTDGQYSDIPFNCAAGTPLSISDTGSTNTQGTNTGCVFIGKFFQFDSASNPPSSYNIFSLAANRSATSLDGSVTPVRSNSGSPQTVDLTIRQNIPQNLTISSTGVTITAGGNTYPNIYGFGFAQSQGTPGAVSGTYASGAQTISLVYVPNLTSAVNETGAITTITGNVTTADSAAFCLTDGLRYAQISVGLNNAAQLSVKVEMRGTTAC